MKISIITVCRNNEIGLRKTIDSVISQTYEDLEYIIIDGGSTDGTINIIAEYQKQFPIILVSEKDEGIYDAMNKGANLATGDWLNFMNAGDTFYDKDSINRVIPFLKDEFDIVYGNTEIVYKDFKTIKDEPEPGKLWMGRIPHQSSFIKSSTMKKYDYNKDNKIVADLEFFMSVYHNGGKIEKINQIISSFAKDGVTEKMGEQVITDAYKTVKKFNPRIIVDVYYNILKIKPFIKRLLPKKVFKLIKIKTKF